MEQLDDDGLDSVVDPAGRGVFVRVELLSNRLCRKGEKLKMADVGGGGC